MTDNWNLDAVQYATRMIERGMPCKEALAADRCARFDSDVVRSTYARLVRDFIEARPPSLDDRDRADNWLKFGRSF